MGNFLNPALKGVHLKLVGKFDLTLEEMEENLRDWNGGEDEQHAEVDDNGTGSPPKKLSVTEMLKRKMSAQEADRQRASGGSRSRATSSQVFSSQPNSSKLKKECDSYELLPYAASGVNQLLWWKDHQELFPLLSHLARVVFAVPAASSKSERVFSVAGNTVIPKRASLDPGKVEDLVIVKTNLTLLREFGYKI